MKPVCGYKTSASLTRLSASLFFTSSKLTQYKEEMKEALDDQTKKGGQRDWVQVGGAGWGCGGLGSGGREGPCPCG